MNKLEKEVYRIKYERGFCSHQKRVPNKFYSSQILKIMKYANGIGRTKLTLEESLRHTNFPYRNLRHISKSGD